MNRKTFGGVLPTLAMAAVATALFPMAPASAVTGPQATPDAISSYTRGVVTGNVLSNDSIDPTLTAQVIDARIVESGGSQYPNADWSPRPVNPTLTWAADGQVSVDFGAYTWSDAPSGVRRATVTYTLRDSAGQTSTAFAYVAESNDPASVSLANDSNADLNLYADHDLGDQQTLSLSWRWLDNDTLGPYGEYRFEVVTPPTHGQIDLETGTYTVPETSPFATRTDSFAYRACLVSTGACSDPATVTLTLHKSLGESSQPVEVTETRGFYVGGPDSFTFNPDAMFAASGHSVPDGHTLTFEPVNSTLDHGSLVDNGDGTWTYTSTGFPAARAVEVIEFNAVDSGGWSDGTRFTLRLDYVPVPTSQVDLVDDEVWVTTGQSTDFFPGQNDTFPAQFAFDGLWVDGTSTRNTSGFTVGTSDLGALTYQGGGRFGPASFVAGSTPGAGEVEYTLCSTYPGLDDCDTATIHINVSPGVQARDDRAVANGAPVDVPVITNDTFNDVGSTSPYAPALKTAQVTVTDVPAGVTAVANDDDRTVTVSLPDGMESAVIGYRLRDWTGVSNARITVTQAAEPAVAPIARDDSAHAVVGEPEVIRVKANDTFGASPRIALVGSSIPDGVTAHVDASGRVVATANRSWAGKTYTLDYHLRDSSGLSDAAKVRVTVAPTEVPPAVTGAEHQIPTAGDAASAPDSEGGLPLLPIGLGASAVLAGLGLAARRKASA